MEFMVNEINILLDYHPRIPLHIETSLLLVLQLFHLVLDIILYELEYQTRPEYEM